MSRQATAHRTQQGPGATLGAAGIVDRTVIVPGIGIAAMIAVATPLLVTVIMTVAIPVGSAIVIAVTIVVIPTAIISIPVLALAVRGVGDQRCREQKRGQAKGKKSHHSSCHPFA